MSELFYRQMAGLEWARHHLTEADGKLCELEDERNEFDWPPSTAFVRRALLLMTVLRALFNAAKGTLKALPVAPTYEIAGERQMPAMAWLENLFANQQLSHQYTHQRNVVETMLGELCDRAVDFYKVMVSQSREFRPYLDHYMQLSPTPTAQALNDLDPHKLQWIFHEFFHGYFVIHQLHICGNVWGDTPADVRGADGRLYTPCSCGCRVAAAQFHRNMNVATELALVDRYSNFMDPKSQLP